ncbi:MAG: BREX-1 system phosphatase PglZ type A [Bacteroidaceae bacterium]|nr:BREX-1 system phosphatase PglZ type A [Bacteroidaceae bacterium]
MVQKRIYSYFERNPQLHVLFIFDKMNIIQTDLEGTEWDEDKYIYKVFDGAWFNTKYAIENTWKEKRIVLLFPETMYPQTEEQMLKFPLLDMLKANMEYKEEDYASFMQQYDLPQKYASFIKRNITEIMSNKISTMLNGHFSAETFSEDVVCRGFISSYLGEKKPLEWSLIIVKMIILGLVSEEKKRKEFFLKLAKNLDAKKAVEKKLTNIFGFSYNPNTEIKMKEVVECLKYNSITQLLTVSPSDNYKQLKISNALQLEQINKLYDTGLHDRILSEKFLNAMQTIGSDIKEESIIESYGIDADYFYMTENLCWPILKAIVESKLVTEPAEANEQMRELSLKFPTNSDIQTVIRFIEQMALYYDKVKGIGTLKLNSPEEYVQRYINEFYLVDMFYRRSLEAYHMLITKEIPIESTLSNAKRNLDREYARISNVLNLEWLTCINEREELFAALSVPKQEDFCAETMDTATKKVVIISDALRFEVAKELMQELSKEKNMASISAMRAMLPTETKFCKLALLPHHSLELQGTEMLVDGQVLNTIEKRTVHLQKYREEAMCVNYEEIMNASQQTAREICKRPLVYIFHNTIDEASHSQCQFEVIRACRTAIEQLAVLVKRLHASWNVSNVIITSDHGFVYNDMVFEEKDKHSVEEDFIEKKTRYYLTSQNTPAEGIAKYRLQSVSGIQANDDTYVAVPIGTNRMAASGGYSFTHGGATLQEMIVPVIRSVQKRKEKTEKVGVSLMNHNLNMVSSQVKLHIIQTEAVSMTVMERKIVCCIYNGDEPVTGEKELVLNSTDSENLNNRVYELSMNLTKSVSSSMLQLRIYDVDDRLNPLIKETVKNSTLIEQDF